MKWRWCGRGYDADTRGALVFFVWCNGQLHGLSASHESALAMAEAVAARIGATVKDFDLKHWEQTIGGEDQPLGAPWGAGI